MKSSMRIVGRDDIVANMEIEMTLGEWKMVKRTLGNSHNYSVDDPRFRLICHIDDLVGQVEKHFWGEEES